MTGILIIADHRQGELSPVTLELVTAAQDLRDGAGGGVSVAVIADSPDTHISAVSVEGVDEVLPVSVPVSEFQPDAYASAVRALIADRAPAVVLVPHTVNGLGYAAAVAAQSGCGFASDVFSLGYDGSDLVATRALYGEKVHVELEFPGRSTVLITVRAGSFDEAQGSGSPSVHPFAIDQVAAPRSTHMQFIEPAADGDVDISQVEFITSIGRGVGEEDNVEQFKELAESMGAVLGCSRPIADSGWLPKSRQVGQSGKTVSACKVYVALGISGSVQHMAGMKHVENIIAVNSDPDAAMFGIARYGVVGDMFEVGEELQNHFD